MISFLGSRVAQGYVLTKVLKFDGAPFTANVAETFEPSRNCSTPLLTFEQTLDVAKNHEPKNFGNLMVSVLLVVR